MLPITLVLLVVAPAQAKPPTLDDLVVVRTGNLPIILSAPHGGRIPIPEVVDRKGDGIAQFATVRDANTDLLAEKIAAEIETALKAKPYLVIAKFERKQADANRAAKAAYEDPKAKPAYDRYHKALADARAEVQKEWARGIVLDVHGQGEDINAVYRGTAGGKSVKHLVDRFGPDALTGPNSVFGRLAKRDVKVIPAIGSKDAEEAKFNGGYIVQTYGSAAGGSVDAIQLEFGTSMREKKALDRTAAIVADAVVRFYKEYLPAEKAK